MVTKFRTDAQRKAIMAKMRGHDVLESAVRRAVPLEIPGRDRRKLIQTYDRAIDDDRYLVSVGSELGSTELGRAIRARGESRMDSDMKFLRKLESS